MKMGYQKLYAYNNKKSGILEPFLISKVLL